MIIVVGGQKGGTGKTTIATNIAVMRAREGRNVLLYDLDPLMLATLWASQRDKDKSLPKINSIHKVLGQINIGVIIRNELQALQSKYQDIIVDARRADETLRAALSLANLAIFPILPSAPDMWTFNTLSNLVAGAQSCNKNFQARILLNRMNTNPVVTKTGIEECDAFLSCFDNLTRFDSFLSQRIAISRASRKGMGIVESDDLKAIRKFESVYEEALSTVRKPGPAQSVLRLPPSLHQKLKEIAFITKDTVSNIGFRALTEYIKTLEK
ncbi:nucleotide-binding protein [Wolbachia endosymbiont (group B) of Episyrphus balteatus]|uniref:nucleotide-binding protein n=1 Tax=Wolbachia endosymbiont (group B) of Episyrphus balteatus TaxID=2954009 RepID=UPI00222807B9|nr:AAA family ATPase [Wolbachia endosymbiont (group B) of Episyrphus balteatus]